MGEYSHIIEEMTWSFSRLDSFEQCPYAWVSLYIYGDEKRNLFFSDFGSCIHSVSAKFFSGQITDSELPVQYISEFYENCNGVAPSRKIRNERFAEGLSYFSSPLSTIFDLAKRKIICVEQKFDISLGGLQFTGFIDLVTDSDGIAVTDHKSSNIKPPSGRTKPTAYDAERNRKARQLYVYAQAVKEIYGCYPDRLEFNCYRTPQIISIPFSKKDMEETVKWANDKAKEISACESYRPSVDFFKCKYICDVADCPYRSML